MTPKHAEEPVVLHGESDSRSNVDTRDRSPGHGTRATS